MASTAPAISLQALPHAASPHLTMPLSLPPIQALEENGDQRFILRNADPNSGSNPDLVISELKLLHEGCRKQVYRTTLSAPIEDAPYVACKVAYGQNAMRKLRREAALYRDGIPLVIDFEDATEEECERKMDVVVNNIRPHPHKFGCRELFALADELGLWKPGQCGPRWAQNGSDD